jgi:mycoredoxin
MGRNNMTEKPVVRVYGREDCVDTQLARRVLGEQGIEYVWHDVTTSPDKREEAKSLNGGSPKVPTIVLPNGFVLIEPNEEQLISALSRR